MVIWVMTSVHRSVGVCERCGSAAVKGRRTGEFEKEDVPR